MLEIINRYKYNLKKKKQRSDVGQTEEYVFVYLWRVKVQDLGGFVDFWV